MMPIKPFERPGASASTARVDGRTGARRLPHASLDDRTFPRNGKPMSAEDFVLSLSCPDRPGIVSAVATHLFENGCNILEAHQFDDVETGRFFMRVRFALVEDAVAVGTVREHFASIAEKFAMRWTIRSRREKQKVLLLVSNFDHCLAENGRAHV